MKGKAKGNENKKEKAVNSIAKTKYF